MEHNGPDCVSVLPGRGGLSAGHDVVERLQVKVHLPGVLVGIAGQPVPDHDALFAHLTGDVVGKSVPMEVLRGGKPQTFMVEVEVRP